MNDKTYFYELPEAFTRELAPYYSPRTLTGRQGDMFPPDHPLPKNTVAAAWLLATYCTQLGQGEFKLYSVEWGQSEGGLAPIRITEYIIRRMVVREDGRTAFELCSPEKVKLGSSWAQAIEASLSSLGLPRL